MVITFGDWELRPEAYGNWQLYRKRATRETSSSLRAGTAGKVRCLPVGRYYQQSTFGNALLYAADIELQEKGGGERVSILEALDTYRSILDMFVDAFCASCKPLGCEISTKHE